MLCKYRASDTSRVSFMQQAIPVLAPAVRARSMRALSALKPDLIATLNGCSDDLGRHLLKREITGDVVDYTGNAARSADPTESACGIQQMG